VADPDHTVQASVTTTDPAGNSITATDTQPYTVDTTADVGGNLAVTINDGDGFINDAEDGAASYTVAGVDPDATATVTFTSTGGGSAVVVSGLGNGPHTVNLSGLNDGIVTATISATDTVGNTVAGTGDTSVLDTTVAASITLNAITADNLIDAAEAGGNVAITGSVGGNVHNGDTVALTVNGNTYTGVVASGLFSITVAGSDLESDGDTTVDASVTTTDLAGNGATAADSRSYDVVTNPVNPNVAVLGGVIWQHSDGTVRTTTSIFGNLPTTAEIAAGDFDGDGDDDLVWHEGIQAGLWQIADGTFEQAVDLPDGGLEWHIQGTGDFDGDGDDDILWRHEQGHVVTWEMEDGAFVQHHHLPVDEHNAAPIADTWQIEGTGDFDGDGDDDILWRHNEGMVVAWEMEDGQYVTNHNLPVVSNSWEIEGTGDFDGDGDSDLLWRHEEGAVVTWEMEDGNYVVNHNHGTVATTWEVEGTADFDGDGAATSCGVTTTGPS